MQTNAAEHLVADHHMLPTTREERGRAIAKQGGIKQIGSRYSVPSQSGMSGGYLVDIVTENCTCPDHELHRGKPHCKHYEAVLFWIVWEGTVSSERGDAPSAKRKTYRQSWPAYNAAQTTEKERVELLLKSLCASIEEPAPKPQGGRPSIPLRDKIFAATMKVYTTFSGRRASTDIRGCAERGHIADAPHYNSIFRCLVRLGHIPELTPLPVCDLPSQ